MPGTLMTTQTTTLSAELRQAYSRALLLAAKPRLVHAQFCESYPVPQGQGSIINLRRFELLADNTSTTPLTEGVTPAGTTLTVTNVPVGFSQYGNFIETSDTLDFTAIDPVLQQGADKLGENMGRTLDIVAREFMTKGTSVIYANGKLSRGTLVAGDKLTGTELKKAVRFLEKSNASRIGGDYLAIISPDTKYDIMGISEWLNAKEYSDPQGLYEGEVGKLYGVRFIETSLAKYFAGAAADGSDVHATVVFGKDAFAKTTIDGESSEMIAKPRGSGGTVDPLNQRSTQGWKAYFGGAVTNDLYVVRIEHGVTG